MAQTDNILKEVWLLTCDPNGKTCDERVFAEMGEEEIAKVSKEIASVVYCFQDVVAAHVSNVIRKALIDGETEIRIDPEDGVSEYILVKVEVDSGVDWCGEPRYDAEDIDSELMRKVSRGDTIYASTGYYGDVRCLFSYDVDGCHCIAMEIE